MNAIEEYRSRGDLLLDPTCLASEELAVEAGLRAAHRRSMTRRLPQFAACWLATMAAWILVLVLEEQIGWALAIAVLVVEAAVLATALGICRYDPNDARVVPTLVTACTLIGLTSTGLFAAARGNGDVLAFVLLTLYLASALFFAWGFGPELVVLVVTVAGWAAAMPLLEFHTPMIELTTAIMIGIGLSLAIAERASRAFALAFHHRENERRVNQAVEASRLVAEQARHEAETATRAKDEFVATLSHELRSPISAVLTWAQMLRQGVLGSDQTTRALEVIERNARTQAKLIEDLLDVSRIASGKLSIELTDVDLRSVVGAALDAVHGAVDRKHLELTLDLASEATVVWGDATRLYQVVENLLSNAIKFTPDGGKIAVSLHRRETEAEITVRDTGIGIAPERLAHLFQRFEQAEKATTRRHGGLGLGLAIARHIVELHGGRITAESGGETRGATFRVVLPRAAHGTERYDEAGRALGSELPSLAGIDVLVVDDEEDARDVLASLLSSCGAGVTMAESADQALMRLSERMPDVMIADVAMPGMDGYALVRKLRAMQGGREKYVSAIALTAFAGTENRRLALEAGFDGHLAKPAEPAEIVAAVARARP